MIQIRKIFKIFFGVQGQLRLSKSKGALWYREGFFIQCKESNK
jgi:hypothetical protein